VAGSPGAVRSAAWGGCRRGPVGGVARSAPRWNLSRPAPRHRWRGAAVWRVGVRRGERGGAAPGPTPAAGAGLSPRRSDAALAACANRTARALGAADAALPWFHVERAPGSEVVSRATVRPMPLLHAQQPCAAPADSRGTVRLVVEWLHVTCLGRCWLHVKPSRGMHAPGGAAARGRGLGASPFHVKPLRGADGVPRAPRPRVPRETGRGTPRPTGGGTPETGKDSAPHLH